MQTSTINLTFHGIGDARAAARSRRRRDVWLELASSSDRVLDSVAGRSDVRITFDDGNASDVEHALPALRRRGLTATFFVVAGRLGEPGFLDERRRPGAGRRRHGDRLPRHAPSALAPARRPTRSRRSSSTRSACSRRSSGARSPRRRARSAPTTAACCSALRRHGYRRVYTSDRGTTRPERLAPGAQHRPPRAMARAGRARSSPLERSPYDGSAAAREAGGEAVAVSVARRSAWPRSPTTTCGRRPSSCTRT